MLEQQLDLFSATSITVEQPFPLRRPLVLFPNLTPAQDRAFQLLGVPAKL
jgi:hypothetical protein